MPKPPIDTEILEDPLLFKELCWPDLHFYDDQVAIIQSVNDNIETYVPAGNMLGKDFVSGFIATWFFASRTPVRVVTSSVDHSQLKGVLWGEIRQFVSTSKYDLGFHINDLMIRQVVDKGKLDPKSEMIGRVAQKGEGLLGRHLPKGPNERPHVLAIIDEASGFDDVHYNSIITWAHRLLVIGNPYECENFFKKGVKGGDLPDPTRPGRFYRKVIQIKAERSPNIRLAQEEIAVGKEPSHREVIPGVMSYREYLYRRATWDERKQTIGLDAEFYEGKETKLFPPNIIVKSKETHRELVRLKIKRRGEAMGVDTAEGGDSTTFTIVDHLGVILQLSIKTPNTSLIVPKTIGFINEYGITPGRVLFDLGGGGKEHADLLRSKGYNVRTIAFGGAPTSKDEFTYYKEQPEDRRELREDRDVYKNRRAEMYGETAKVLSGTHPSGIGEDGFGIPSDLEELLRQLPVFPKLYDGEGKMYLPPKNKPTPGYTGMTISGMIGHSPDEADSFVLAVFGMIWEETESIVTSMF